MALVKEGEKSLQVVPSGEASTQLKNKKKQKILDEDTYIQSLDKIIQRDFYPDLEDLQMQNDYLEALQNNDVQRLQELAKQNKIPGSSRTLAQSATPSTFETPSTVRGTPCHSSNKDNNSQLSEARESSNPEKTKKDDSDLSLDKFLAKNTSEDNASFDEIDEAARRKHMEKYAWLYNREQEDREFKAQQLALPQPKDGDQFMIEPRRASVELWNYTNKNSLMYYPDGVELSAAEAIREKGKKEREIVHENTRFKADMFSDVNRTLAHASAFHENNQQGKIGHDGKEIKGSETPKVNGFGFVATPSPAPGVDASPLMTWGEIESTPLRLEPGDTPRCTSGPTFKMPDPKPRDLLGIALAEKVSQKQREKKRAALAHAASTLSKTPKRMNTEERLKHLSPAAQKLITSKLMTRSRSDKALRASYTPSPHRVGASTPKQTPDIGNTTPRLSSELSSGSSTPSLTDNLLRLSKH